MVGEIAAEYLPVLLFLGLALAVSVAVVVFSLFIAKQKPNKEKLSVYEQGFDALGDARPRFNARFCVIAVLFAILDIEVVFLFPWAVALGDIGLEGFLSMAIFIFVLALGLAYGWKKRALEWK